jgi:ribosomal protein S27E
MKLAPVTIEQHPTTGKFRAVCEKCGYYSVYFSLAQTAIAFAKEHKASRFHRTNSVPYRYGLGG